jgi:lipoate-protein ligase A
MISSNSHHWQIETDWDQTGAYHMRRDEELARNLLNDPTAPNVLRLYTWKPFAISLGYMQSEEIIDHTACGDAGIDIVRRPTGGRAVFHAEELTYAVVMRSDPSEGIYATHNRITKALLDSFAVLKTGSEALQLTRRENATREAYQGSGSKNIACFASSSRHEALYDGRKFLGSAQRRFGDVILQHGSILLGAEHLRLPEFLKLSDDRRRDMAELLQTETATLSEAMGRRITAAEASDCLRDGFVDHFCAAEIDAQTRSSVELDTL